MEISHLHTYTLLGGDNHVPAELKATSTTAYDCAHLGAAFAAFEDKAQWEWVLGAG